MDLDTTQMGYFIEQVGLSAASFGVAKADVHAVADALTKLFNYRCAPKTTVIPAQGPQFQSICTDKDCPLADNAMCSAQPQMPEPMVAHKTMDMGEGGMPSGSASPSPSASGSSAAVQSAPGLTGVFAALVAFLAL